MKIKQSFFALITALFLIICPLKGEVRLSGFFADNMILQREQPVTIWGFADKGERVEVEFVGEKKRVKADINGSWQVRFSPQTTGGEQKLVVKGRENSVEIEGILFGDLWFCSGQSNMEMTVDGWARVENYEREKATANYPLIRTFNTKQMINTLPQNDVVGEWLVCSPATVADFSATAYFFGRKLHQETGVPIGLVHSSWGGTDIETWISRDAFATLPEHFGERYDDFGSEDFEQMVENNVVNKERYEKALRNDIGLSEKWYETGATEQWKTMQVPEAWEDNELRHVDGLVWFSYTFTLPKGSENANYVELSLGCIDDNDITWINGKKVGESRGYNLERRYRIEKGILKSGKNTIVVRVHDEMGGGGIYSSPDKLYIEVDGERYSIGGEWLYRASVTNLEYGYKNLSPNSYPSLLYNAMVHPLLKLPVKGAIWYQGENNENEAYNYRTLFPLLIENWRTKWNNAELPFYWVQLANYKAEDTTPSESEWAELREAQDMTLSLPNTGQAVIIDIGDAWDIHPQNKQDVGLRLALIALNRDYGKECDYLSPRYRSHTVEGDKIVVEFDNVESGLVVNNKYGYITGFAVAAADGKFHWAKAELRGEKVVVCSEKVSKPTEVRYCWGNNPEMNLYNGANLPMAPFRSDSRKGITQKN